MNKYPLAIVPLASLSPPNTAPKSNALHTLLARQDRSTAAVVDAAALRIDASEGFVQAALHLRDHRVSEAVTRRVLLTKKRR